MRLVQVDLDGSLPAQEACAATPEWADAQRIDMRQEGPGLRILATRRAVRRFVETLGPHAGDPEVVFYGSGDFHHLTAALLLRHEQQLTVIHFDNHPDWTAFPPTFNCGGWVARALAMPHVEKVITLGPCSDDFVLPELKMTGLGALRAGRHEVFPWRCAPSRVLGRYGDGPDRRQDDGRLLWRNLGDEHWPGFLDELIERLPQTALYITVDKDVLTAAEAHTNWDQGEMPLASLIAAIERLANARPIIGIDVCGDYSAPRFRDPLRWGLARLDHPRQRPAGAAGQVINARTNAALLSCFARVLS